MRVSVVYSTCRFGGMDILFDGLMRQTLNHKDFELVLVDEFFDERREALEDYMMKLNVDFPIQYIKPKPRPHVAISSGFNAGLMSARGELICFLNDYIWVYPDWLKHHWEIYKKYRGYSLSGFLYRYSQPELTSGDMLISAFKKPFTPEVFNDLKVVYYEIKGHRFTKKIDYNVYELSGDTYYAGLNESIPMRILEELNGFDERFDGGFANQDIDLGIRANVIGWRFCVDVTYPPTREIDHSNIPTCHNNKTIRTNQEGYRFLMNKLDWIGSGMESIKAPNKFDLLEVRSKWLRS